MVFLYTPVGVGMGASSRAKLSTFENDWLTPAQAVSILDSVYGTDSSSFVSKHTLLERLRGGMVDAIARESKREDRSDGTLYFDIPPEHWRHASENSIFWRSGDYSLEVRENYQHFQVRHFDVRFDPEAIRTIIISAGKSASSDTAVPEAEDEETGPPVSEELLRQWHAVYRRAYQGPNDTLANALKSARGMFPGKFVSRDRIRKIAGGRIRGRKPGPSEAE